MKLIINITVLEIMLVDNVFNGIKTGRNAHQNVLNYLYLV